MTTIYDPDDIRRIRLGLKLTTTEFASMLGVSASTIWYWEHGHRRPRLPVHERIRKLTNRAKPGTVG